MNRDFTAALRVVSAALALAEHYFPQRNENQQTVVSAKDAHFFMTGQYHHWSRWETLSDEEALRCGRLLARRGDDLASRHRFLQRVRELCRPNAETGQPACATHVIADPDHPDIVIPTHSRHPLQLVDELLYPAPRHHPIRIATTGSWECRTRNQQIVEIPQFHRDGVDAARTRWPSAGTSGPMPELRVDLDDLLRTAARIDRSAGGQSYRQRQLRKMFMRTVGRANGEAPLGLLTAGRTRLLNAPTAMGKSVLIEVLATHLAARGLTVAVLVVDVRATFQTARGIQRAITAICPTASCTPLVSPQSRYDRALTAIEPATASATVDQPEADDMESLWRFDQLAYGCALSEYVDQQRRFHGGHEPCHRLHRLNELLGDDVRAERRNGSRESHWCPFAPGCDKFAQVRAACSASVVVTNHDNFHVGRTHYPIEIDGVVETNMSVAELLLRRAHVVLVDEIDVFQSHGFAAGTSNLVLADRPDGDTPIRRLEAHLDELRPGAAARIRPAVQQVKYLSEQLLDLLLVGELTPDPWERLRRQRNEHGKKRTRTDWYQPGSWDRMVLETVFGLPDASMVSLEQQTQLASLLPPNAVRASERPDQDRLPEHLRPIRDLLGQFITIRSEQNESDDLSDLRAQVTEELGKLGLDRESQVLATHGLIMRTWLSALRAHLYSLVEEAGTLRESGVAAAQQLADGVGIYGGNHPVPYGPLGHLLFGFRFIGLGESDTDGKVVLELIRGDAHTVTARLGDIVALARAGQRRIVLGMSATARLYGAAQEHVFTDLDWYVSDTDAGATVAFRSDVVNELGKAVEIGGTPLRDRLRKIAEMGQLLAPTVEAWIADLEAHPSTAHRARVLLATNSYSQAVEIANGLVRGPSRSNSAPVVFVAVPDDVERRGSLRPASGVAPIARDQFERFAALGGKVLVAPISVVARALNILSPDGRGRRESALAIVGVCVRPVMPVTEPSELAANIAAHAYANAKPSLLPAGVLDELRRLAATRMGVLLCAPREFSALPSEIKRDLVAGLLVDLVQLIGRARRGQTSAQLHFIDGALHDTRWKSDLPALIRMLYDSWNVAQRGEMRALYGSTLDMLLDYAGIIDPVEETSEVPR